MYECKHVYEQTMSQVNKGGPGTYYGKYTLPVETATSCVRGVMVINGNSDWFAKTSCYVWYHTLIEWLSLRERHSFED